MLFPAWTPLTVILYILFALLSVGMGLSEHFGLMTMKYSKFRAEKGIDSRLGMSGLYFTPLIAALGFSLSYLRAASVIQSIVLIALCGHFAKRCLEVLFVHKYSGPMEIASTLMIAAFYTLVAAGISFLNAWPLLDADNVFWIGLLLFAFGETANFTHHKLLADQRGSSKKYILPKGGWFEYVACPHYLFEIIAWLGLALMSRHLFTWIALLGMAGYLLARSLKTLAWYRKKFRNYPRERKALIPYVI